MCDCLISESVQEEFTIWTGYSQFLGSVKGGYPFLHVLCLCPAVVILCDVCRGSRNLDEEYKTENAAQQMEKIAQHVEAV